MILLLQLVNWFESIKYKHSILFKISFLQLHVEIFRIISQDPNSIIYIITFSEDMAHPLLHA